MELYADAAVTNNASESFKLDYATLILQQEKKLHDVGGKTPISNISGIAYHSFVSENTSTLSARIKNIIDTKPVSPKRYRKNFSIILASALLTYTIASYFIVLEPDIMPYLAEDEIVTDSGEFLISKETAHIVTTDDGYDVYVGAKDTFFAHFTDDTLPDEFKELPGYKGP